jgi:SpoVK/Ycf46/Vps4 family AAA+-type ATPase
MLLILFYAVAVAAVFSLTYKLQPAIIFMDAVDSFLGQLRTDREFLLLKHMLHLCSLLIQ